MPTEWFHASKPEVFLGIRRADINALFADAGLIALITTYLPLITANTITEPMTVALVDQGVSESQRADILVIPVGSVQIDGGLNEIPQATVRTAVGRDGVALAAGATDATAVAIGHLLEKYFSTFRIPARIYCRETTTWITGALDTFDAGVRANEWVVLFDGTITGVSRQGSADSAAMVLHLTHFTADLSLSSSLSGQVAAGAFVPAAMSPLLVPFRSANALPPAFTMFGATAAAIAGGRAAETDFWGYQVPGGVGGNPPSSVGLKGFLALLGRNDVFAFENLTRADLGGTVCTPEAYGRKRNDRALNALARIEPVWPNWDTVAASSAWTAVFNGVRAVMAAKQAGGSTQSVSREELINAIGAPGFSGAGYRYGMPISFYLVNSVLANLSTGRAFATDIAAATFADLAAHSFWDLIAGPYSRNYQIALAPMADRAVVMPTQPLSDRYWQSVGASEIASWDRDFRNPIPLRGIVLVGDHPSNAGVYASGNDASAPGAQERFQQLSAGYDSCDDGVFEFRSMPPWLFNMWRPPQPYGALTATPAGRATAFVPWVVGAVAERVVDAVVGTAVAATLAAAYVATGIIRGAAAAPPGPATSTASRLAKAMYQQERTRHNTYYVTTRFRYDIGPGSVIKVELPSDRYVRAALLGQQDTVVYGMVLRVSLVIDCEAKTAATHLQMGFARTESQARTTSKLFANSHPFWSTTCLGVPWADAQWIRNRLGNGSSIATVGT